MTSVDVMRWTPGSTASLGSFVRRILDGRPSVARAVSRFSGSAMIVLGVLLLAEHLFT